jgi:DNA-binding Lrp family transcriptional regulator
MTPISSTVAQIARKLNLSPQAVMARLNYLKARQEKDARR